MAEELDEHLRKWGVNSAYIHSDVDTIERIRILEDLRDGVYDVLIGVNLLREGLDLPQVSLVAILDADKEGFLRNHRSLTQTAGRAARNVNGKVIMYADKITDSMRRTIDETERRRSKQMAYTAMHGITPTPIVKKSSARDLIQLYNGEEIGETNTDTLRFNKFDKDSRNKSDIKRKNIGKDSAAVSPRPYIEEERNIGIVADPVVEYMSADELKTRIEQVNKQMLEAAKKTEFIEAARLRDELLSLQELYETKK